MPDWRSKHDQDLTAPPAAIQAGRLPGRGGPAVNQSDEIATLAKTLPPAAVEAAWRAGAAWTGGADSEFYARIVAAALPHVRDSLRESGATWVDRREVELIMRRMALLRAVIGAGAAPDDVLAAYERALHALSSALGVKA